MALPPELDRVLRDYERAWRARDARALSALFAEDGFVLSSSKPPVRGRAAIREAYTGAGGPLFLRALAHGTDGNLGYIIGTFGGSADAAEGGKFVLTLVRRNPAGPWLIMADMDNSSRPRPSPPGPAPALTPAATP
ncbi:MAG: DUF4440 domain-containing protein [Thermoanaerobaculia bacterium]